MDNLLKKVKKVAGKDEDPLSATSVMLDRYWSNSQSARKELDWKWFHYDLWYNGNHYAKWNPSTQQIVSTAPKKDGQLKLPVNKIYSTVRGVRSYVLKNSPKANVTPFDLTDQNVDQAVQLNHFMDYIHDHLHLRASLRASMLHALKYSVGFWQVMWDENAEDGQGEITINVIDPYDLYWDPTARLPKEARYVVLAVRRNIADLKEDPKYKDADWDSIVGDKFLSSSTLKSRLLEFERGGSQSDSSEKADGTVIVREFWYKETKEEELEVDDDENPGKKKKIKQSKPKIMLATKVGETFIRKPIDTGLSRFPFFRLCSDVEPLAMYGQGWVKNLIPLNRGLNTLESSAMEYNILVNKGKYHVEKGAGFRSVPNEHGVILETKKGYAVTPMDVPTLSPLLSTQIENLNRYIEDIGCLHDASLGRIPTGATSGVSIEALQEGDSNNLSELTENTIEFLEDVYEYVLQLASEKYQTLRNVITTTQTGERIFMKVIGEGADPELQAGSGTVVIPSKNIVDVKIDSYLAYTSDGRQQAIKDLAQIMLANQTPLDPETILEAYETGNIADIIQRMKKHQQEQQQQQMQMQQQQGEMQNQQALQQQQAQGQQQMQQKAQEAQLQQQQQPQGAGMQEAIAFIRQVLEGNKPELPQNIDQEFVAYLDHFIQSSAGQSLPPIILKELQKDRDMAMMAIRGSNQQAVQ